MKQIILPFHTGRPALAAVPAPVVQPGEVLIRTTASVVSTGTERMLLEFGKAGLIGKARQQPERVRDVLNKIKTDGLRPTISAVRRKLDNPVALGYSQVGVVLAVGAGIRDLRAGDRVASNGAHAEIVSVARNLAAKIPDGVTDEAAAFTVLGAIALQGMRLAQPTFGETVVVYGLGLIGQLTAQLLLAAGCRVIGVDLDESRLALAAKKGVQRLTDATGDAVRALTAGHGADAVIITASSDSNAIISTAADMCRKRGRIVLIGVVGMQLRRDDFFKKELSFQVSASYGPGRYERGYEQHGLDYPIGYVRWTEGRNFDAVLQAMAGGRLDTAPLITARKPLEAFSEVYDSLADAGHLATVFTYNAMPDRTTIVAGGSPSSIIAKGTSIAVIGAGNFTASTLLPALKAAGAPVKAIISRTGLSAATLAKQYGIAQAGTDSASALQDDDIGAVMITTQHDTHAGLAAAALQAGRHVFVEKPLALTRSEADAVLQARGASSLAVGFNRRFAPLAVLAKDLTAPLTGPFNIVITVNAGHIPPGHWTQDEQSGGGRLIGEACHFIDLCAFFAGSLITGVCANAAAATADMPHESASILLRFADGSNAVVNYFSNGSKAYDKERVELYRGGRTVVIENWRGLRSFGFRKDISKRAAQDKGHRALIGAWLQSIQAGGAPVMAFDGLINTTLAAIAVPESIAANAWIGL